MDFHCIVFKETFWKRHPWWEWKWLWVTLNTMIIIKILVWFICLFLIYIIIKWKCIQMHPITQAQKEKKLFPLKAVQKSMLPSSSSLEYCFIFFSLLLSLYKQVYFSFIQRETKSFLWNIDLLLLKSYFSVFLFNQASSKKIYHAS